MTKRTWHSGPPPSVGWWPASAFGDPESIRWWDGVRWSATTWPHYKAAQAAGYAEKPAYHPQHNIKWTERWWE